MASRCLVKPASSACIALCARSMSSRRRCCAVPARADGADICQDRDLANSGGSALGFGKIGFCQIPGEAPRDLTNLLVGWSHGRQRLCNRRFPLHLGKTEKSLRVRTTINPTLLVHGCKHHHACACVFVFLCFVCLCVCACARVSFSSGQSSEPHAEARYRASSDTYVHSRNVLSSLTGKQREQALSLSKEWGRAAFVL